MSDDSSSISEKSVSEVVRLLLPEQIENISSEGLIFVLRQRIQLLDDYDRALFDVTASWLEAERDAHDWSVHAARCETDHKCGSATVNAKLKYFDQHLRAPLPVLISDIKADLVAAAHGLKHSTDPSIKAVANNLESMVNANCIDELTRKCSLRNLLSSMHTAPPKEVEDLLQKVNHEHVLATHKKMNPKYREATVKNIENIRKQQSKSGAIKMGKSVFEKKQEWKSLDKELEKEKENKKNESDSDDLIYYN